MQQTQQQQQQQQVTVQTQSQTQQQQQSTTGTTANGQVQKTGAKPILKSSTTVSGPIINAVTASVAASRSSPKPKVWNNVQVSEFVVFITITRNIIVLAYSAV